jgi:hypothetical protein
MHVYIYKILQDENTLWESDNFLKNLRIEDNGCRIAELKPETQNQ